MEERGATRSSIRFVRGLPDDEPVEAGSRRTDEVGTDAAAETYTIPDELFTETPIYDALVLVLPDPRLPAPVPVADVKKAEETPEVAAPATK